MRLQICPRCRLQALEELLTHSHCIACEYSPERNPDIGKWAALEYRQHKFHAQRRDDYFPSGNGEEYIPLHLRMSRPL